MENILFFVVLLGLGFFVGRQIEKNHFRSLANREEQLQQPCLKNYPKRLPSGTNVERSVMVLGQVVISIDFFKKTVATIVNFFGGEIFAYESLVERGRREAILRLRESCKDADDVINLRIETSSISKNDNRVGAIEVLAYGTAIYLKKNR